MPTLIKQIWNNKDVPSAILLTVIVGVACWIAALPFNQSVQETFLRRFHLASPNFASWAIQQPVPSMYNFENRIWACKTPLTEDQRIRSLQPIPSDDTSIGEDGDDVKIETSPINHFPTRTFTFGRSRAFLKHNPSWYFYLKSRYRDQEIRSTFQISPVNESEIQVKRLEVTVD